MAATTKNYDTCGDKVIVVNDDDKVLLPPSPDKAAANKEEPHICLNIFMYSILLLYFFANLVTVYYDLIFPDDTTGLPKFQIQSLLTTPISYPPKISPVDFNLTFSITNGLDSGTILYNFDSVSLYYHNVFLSNTTLIPLFQCPKEQLTVDARFAVRPANADEWVVKAIVEDRRRRELVELGVKVEATVKIGPDEMSDSDWPRKEQLARVTCKGVKVVFSSNSSSFGTLEAGPKDCKFEFHH